MEICLLCAEIIHDSVNCIIVNSEKWNKKNMKFLIEKHLWQMDTIKTSSAVCQDCGEQLSNFHTFYRDIWKAQTDESTHVQNEHVILQSNYCGNKQGQDKVDKDNDFRKNGDIEPEIPIEQIVSNEFPILQLTPDGVNLGENECNINEIQEICDDLLSSDDILEDNTESTNEIKDPMTKSNTCKQTGHTDTLEDNTESTNKTEDPMTKSNTCNQTGHTQANTKNFRIRVKKCLPNISPDESSLNTNEKSDLELDEYNSDNKGSFERKKKKPRNDAKTVAEYDRILAEIFEINCNLCNVSFETFPALLKHFRKEHNRRGYARCCSRNFFSRPRLVDHLIRVHMNTDDCNSNDWLKLISNHKILERHSKTHEDKSKLLKCDICSKVFVKSEVYDIHLRSHFTKKPFKCNICDKFFKRSGILRRHILGVHENKYAQICEVCGKSIRCPSNFALHMEAHKPKKNLVGCDICGLLLSNEAGLKKHKKYIHPEGGRKDHKCHICSKVSPTMIALASHIREMHKMRPSAAYKCKVCGKICKTRQALKEHMAAHTGTVLYKCDWCPKECRTYINLYYHRTKAHPKEWEEHMRGKYESK